MDLFTQDTIDAEVMRLSALAQDKRLPYFDPLARPTSGAEQLIGFSEQDSASIGEITLDDVDEAAGELAAATGLTYEDIMSVVRAGATGRDAAELALSVAALAGELGVQGSGDGDTISLAVSQAERDQLAETGQALPGGDFPVHDAHHLALAKGEYKKGNLAGHSREEVRRHINKNAKRLGLPGLDDDDDHDSGDDVQATRRLVHTGTSYETVPLSGSYDSEELLPDYSIAARAARDLARYVPAPDFAAEAEIARLTADHGDILGLAQRGRTHLHTDSEDTRDHAQPHRGGDVHAEMRRIIEQNPDLFAPDHGRTGPEVSGKRIPVKSRIQRAAEQKRARSMGTGAPGGPHSRTLAPSRYM
jgi:hypothetical protein